MPESPSLTAVAPAKQIPTFGPSQSALPIIITLAAGETRQLVAQGQWFYVKESYLSASASAAEDIEIQSDISPPMPFNVGTGFVFPGASQFRFLIVKNTNAAAVYLEIVVGYGQYIDNRLNIVRTRPAQVQPVQDQASEMISDNVSSIAATTAVPFSSTPPTGYGQQRAVIIANADPNSSLYVRDSSGNPVGIVFAESTQVYYFSGDFQVYNPTGVAITYFVGRVWYLPQSA